MLVEDIAYSLLGIFNVDVPTIYGEGNRAVGRLLEHILTGSGGATILAWTWRAGRYMPINLTVYNQLLSHNLLKRLMVGHCIHPCLTPLWP
jgi:hypothetical protein